MDQGWHFGFQEEIRCFRFKNEGPQMRMFCRVNREENCMLEIKVSRK